MTELKDLKPVDFRTVPATKGCTGCVFLDESDERRCKICHNLDLLDLAIEIDKHFGINCLKNKIIYKTERA